ncbi:hypothetical protein D1872_51460 [compost metagenome]
MSDNGKLETRYYKLEKLVKWEHVATVNEMLMTGISPHEVSRWCKERGFSISHPKLYEYKELLQEAITRRITVERLLGIGVPKRTPIVLQALGIQGVKQHVKNELEVLDTVIHLGMSALSQSPTIKVETALKAIELKNKLTDGKHAGLTNYGLDQLRELEQAKFNAMIEVVLKYVPEDKHEELDAAIAAAERQFYHDRAPELVEEYEKAVQEGMEEIIVSDEETQF